MKVTKKVGVADHPSELNLSKFKAMATFPSCEYISSFVLVHDIACRCNMNCVGSKYAHKQLARMSFNAG